MMLRAWKVKRCWKGERIGSLYLAEDPIRRRNFGAGFRSRVASSQGHVMGFFWASLRVRGGLET